MTKFDRNKLIAMVLEDYLERKKQIPWGMLTEKTRDMLITIEEMANKFRRDQYITVPRIPTDKMQAAGEKITEQRLAPSWTALEVYKAMTKEYSNVSSN